MLKKEIKELKEEINNFLLEHEGDDLVDYVGERLNKTFESYAETIVKSYNYLATKESTKVLKKLSKEED